MMKITRLVTVLLVIICSSSGFAQTFTNLFSEQDLRSTIKFLSDDGFEGRAPGKSRRGIGGEVHRESVAACRN